VGAPEPSGYPRAVARNTDRRAALAALISAAVMIAQQVGSKATRDALFLSSFDAEDLPRVVIASAAASMVAVFAASRAFARFGPARVVPVAFGVSGALYLTEWLLVDQAPRPIAVVLFLHTAVFGALVISGFWSVVNERFDPHSAKGMVSRIGTGATVGGVVGGIVAWRVGEAFDANAMLVVLAGLNGLAALGVARIGGGEGEHDDPVAASTSGLRVLLGAPYLRALAAIVVLTAVSAGLLDYAFKAEAARQFEQGSQDMLSFFAIFHVGAAVLSLLLQTVAAKPALERLGVAGSVATLPTVVLMTAAVAAGLTRIGTVVVARAAELVLANSIFRSGYELLYTPVSPEKKRPTKALIDVAGNRVGDALGSGVVIVILAVAPAVSLDLVLGFAAAFAALSLVIARRLHKGYVGQLEESLRQGTPFAAERAVLEAATLQTLSTLGLDREALFEQLAAHQSWSDRSTHPTVDSAPSVPPDGIDAPADDPVHARARTLRSGTPDEIRAALTDEVLDPRLAPFAIALLARRDVHHDAIRALRGIADEIPTELSEAVADADQPFAIRRRLPRVLEVCDAPEAFDGLARGLDDSLFEVRYRCALALSRIATRHPERRLPVETVHAAVKSELGIGRKVWEQRRLLDDDTDEDAPLLDKARRDRVHRSVEHVFTVLSLAYDPEPLRLSLVALATEDGKLRGTALEYLENVLPEDIKEALFPMLDVRVEIRKRRSREEIVDDLVRSMQSLDAKALERAIRASERPKPDEP